MLYTHETDCLHQIKQVLNLILKEQQKTNELLERFFEVWKSENIESE